MSQKEYLKKIIEEKAYTESVKEYFGSESLWVMDFKQLSIQPYFLKVFSEVFFEYLDKEGIEEVQIGGLEAGALPLISGIAIFDEGKRIKNTFYVRKARKKYSIPRQIEGLIDDSLPIILIDDLINSGKSIQKQIEVIKSESKSNILGIFCAIRFRDFEFYQEKFGKDFRLFIPFELNDFNKSLSVNNIEDKEKPDFGNKFKHLYGKKLSVANYFLVVPKSSPVNHGDSLYFGADDGHFFRIEKETGKILWSKKVAFGSKSKIILSTPVIWREHVIFGAYDGVVYCLSTHDGSLEWSFIDADWVGSSPCVNEEDGVVFIGLEFGLFNKQGGLVAIDISTGKILWKNYLTMKDYTHASPYYDCVTKTVFCGCNDSYFRAYNAKNGSLLWEYKTDGEVKYSAISSKKHGAILFGSMDGYVYMLKIQTGELIYKFNALFGFYSNPILFGDSIIACSLDKRIYSFNLNNGEKNWEYQTSGRIFSTPIIFEDLVFVGGNDGRVYEIYANSGELRSFIQLGERITNKVHVEKIGNKKRVYILNHGCELHLFEEFSTNT